MVDEGKSGSRQRARRIKPEKMIPSSLFSQSVHVAATVELNYLVTLDHAVLSYRTVYELFPHAGRERRPEKLKPVSPRSRLNRNKNRYKRNAVIV